MKVLCNAYQCREGGVSESFVGFNTVSSIADLCDVSLLTHDHPVFKKEIEIHHQSQRFSPSGSYLKRLEGAVKIDYFIYNRLVCKKLASIVGNFDVFHHITPIAPRYPVSLAKFSKNFVIGPVGGGLRVPKGFRSSVESSEDLFFKLRNFDAFRFAFDPWLIKTYERAKLIYIVGEYMLGIIPERYHEKCELMLETGINTNDYFPEFEESEVLRLLYVGRIVPYKGLKYVLLALGSMAKADKQKILFKVVGDQNLGNYGAECLQLVEQYNLQNCVLFEGPKSKEEVKRYYDWCHVLCFPSLAETSGNVLLESMAAGKPALCIKYGGPGEIVSEDTGYFLDYQSEDTLVRSIRERLVQLLGSKKEIAHRGSLARKRVEQYFDWKSKGKRIFKDYQTIVGET